MGGRLTAALLLIIMFGLGLVTGISWERYAAARRPAFPVNESPRLRRFYHELNLTPDQENRMDAIFAKAHERATQINEEVSWDLTEVHDDSLHAIQDILTPEQRIRFEIIRHHLRATTVHKRRLEPVIMPASQ